MLAAVAPATLARLRFPLGELTKPQVRALAAEAGLPVASKAESQDLCFLAGTGKAAFLARHAGLDDRPGEIVDRDGHRARAATAARTTSPSASARASASPRRSRSTCSPPTWVRTASWPVRARRSRPPRSRCAAPAAPGGRGGRRRQAALPLAPVPCRVAAERGRGRVELELLEPVDGAAPGQTACLLRGDVVVGLGDDRRAT